MEDPSGEPKQALSEQLSSQVTALEHEVTQAENTVGSELDDSEVQARIRQLIDLIRGSLRSRSLDAKTQKELARLLSLTPRLNNRHIQQVNLLELAISTLLEPSEQNDSSKLLTSPGQGSAAKNLVFVQETRRQIAQQSRKNIHVGRAIFTGDGTPYTRLISGLSWFFLTFVVMPGCLLGSVLLVREVARDIANYEEAIEEQVRLTSANSELLEKDSSQQQKIKDLTQQEAKLIARLSTTNSKLQELSGIRLLSEEEALPAAEGGPQPAEVVLLASDIREILKNIDRELQAGQVSQSEPVPAPEPGPPEPVSAEAREASSSGELIEPSLAAQIRDITAGKITEANELITDRFYLMLLTVSMGALGSTISVIVRANVFIQQAQETDNDLFLTGFFRPLVGMSFAIFCVAIVEAGIFSGLFDLSQRDNADQHSFYIAIAFVAGFSERLVRDVVIKTEDTLAGPAPRK
ncbi:MAG: hypothetical protein AAFO06_17925 [Cyanobacteria bacterium J06597_16]